ncbi:MAG: ABC transporter permease [Woeseiaceae bacterium]|nr:ABC transporter permease [Woeseiaceae bacterium]
MPTISAVGLTLTFLPAILALAIMHRWRAGAQTALYATIRMLVQLTLIGYVLIAIFEADHLGVIALVLAIMLVISSWIAVRTVRAGRRRAYWLALAAITIAGLGTLGPVTQFVIGVEPWFSPRFVIPLAGMIFASCMNAVSLAAERFEAETERGVAYGQARRAALDTALIPVVNSLFAVGLVSLPGMMTGQILSGVSPLIAAKYQIVVMTTLFGAAGIAAAIYLYLAGSRTRQPDPV